MSNNDLLNQYIEPLHSTVTLHTICDCYLCHKNGHANDTSCASCFKSTINAIVRAGGNYKSLINTKLIQRDNKYFHESGRECIDSTFIACATVFNNIKKG